MPSSPFGQMGEPLREVGIFIMEEIWKDIPEYEGFYQASNLGNIKGLKKNKIIGKTENHKGYFHISLCKNGNPKTMMAHRAVGLSFIPNPENKPQINHKDLNKKNNRVDNLEWVTNSENQLHAIANGKTGYLNGEKSYKSSFTNKQAEQIRKEYIKNSNTNGTNALAKRYNTTQFCIWRIVNNKSYLK